MLTALAIEDIVLITQLQLDCGAGLHVLTGETGAGKSILLDSFGLALGARADTKLIRTGASKGQVTASFKVPAGHPIEALLEEAEIDLEDELILRRVVRADGSSKAFINDRPVSAGLVRQIAQQLVEIHGQHDERGLLDPRGHLALLDQFAGHAVLVAGVAARYQAQQDAHKALAKAKAAFDAVKAEEAYLTDALEEFDKLQPQPGEEQQLAEARAEMQRGQRMLASLQEALDDVGQDGGLDAALRGTIRKLSRLPEADDPRLQQVLDAFDQAATQTADAISGLEALVRTADGDPQALEETEVRLFDLRALARKHDVQPEALGLVEEKLRSQMAQISGGEADLKDLQAVCDAAAAGYISACEALSVSRAKAAQKLDKAVNAELPPLKLDAARFKTQITQLPQEKWGAAGAEQVGFEVSTNPGASFGPIIKIASGGELARFILALKVSLAAEGGAGVMIFDEVDRGLGGSTASAVGQRLARLAENAQVIVVTHSPQVAALGARHWQIQKRQSNGSAQTDVTLLDAAARREELARMLSGEEITDAARAAADSLLA